MSDRMVLPDVMNVVCCDQLDPELAGQLGHPLKDRFLFLETVVLDLKVEIGAEDLLKRNCGIPRLIEVTVDKVVRDNPRGTGRECHEPVGVPSEKLEIDPGFIVKPFDKAEADKLDEVAIPGEILCQQHKVVVDAAPFPLPDALGIHLLVESCPACYNVDFAPDDRFDSCLPGCFVEFDRTKHDAVVGKRHRGHLILSRSLHQPVNGCRAVKQAVMRVIMEVDEVRHERIPVTRAWQR